MMFTVAIVAMSIGVVLCGESCFSVPQGHIVTLTCSGQAKDTFRHIYWKSGRANEVIASCYDSHDHCYSHDTQRYRANREDPSDTSFESSLIINDVGEGMIIKCFLWLAGTQDEIIINTTRVLVDGDCDRIDIEVPTISTTFSATTTANIISQTITTEQNYDINIGEVKYVDTSRECLKRICDLSHHSFVVLCIIVMLFAVVCAMIVRRKIAMRRKLINVIPHYNDQNDRTEGDGHFYNNLNFSADVVNSSVSPALHLPLPPRPVRPCTAELNESFLQPPAYSEIDETGALLNDVQINSSLAHTLSCDEHGQQIDYEQIRDSTTRQYYRSNPTMKLPQTFPYNQISMEPNSPPPDYNTSIRLKPPH